MSELNKENIEVNEIGKVTREGINIINYDLMGEIQQPDSDELYKVI